MHTAELNQELAYKISKVNFMVRKATDSALREQTAISYSQFFMLMALSHNANMPQRSIAEFLGLTPAAVSRQLDALVELGIITREENSKNRREHVITLTAQGESTMKKAHHVVDIHLNKLTEALTAEQKQSLIHCLEVVIQCCDDCRTETNPLHVNH
jgi:DNA-binding MarR family transcriptional regulator